MLVRNVKKHGINEISYAGEMEDSKVIVVFEDGAIPVEGDLRVLTGKMVTKNNQNFYYVKKYLREVEV